MNIEHLRKSLKAQWLTYYRDNRSWLTHLGVWVTCEGERRPSSSFILGTLSTLEPQLVQLLPLIVDLSSNPDRIVIALGLNFNPDDELESFEAAEQLVANGHTHSVRMLPQGNTVEVAVQRMTGREPEPESEANPFEALPETVVHSAQPEQPQAEQSQTEQPPMEQPQSNPAQPTQKQKASDPAKQSPEPTRQPNRSQSFPAKPQPAPPIAKPTAKPTTTPPIAPAVKAPLVNPKPKPAPNPDDTLADRPVQSITSSPSVFEQRFSVVRPVMDSVELSAGELPKREVEETNDIDREERTPHSDR
ncbi:DUF5331 domain-containing protein [Egbenema bharatensis]|uniref:DUF5331 domain-containing protein n=1 Tax=Egbenema bharatensis TaxID=3463334 RepID=UPI003A8783A8